MENVGYNWWRRTMILFVVVFLAHLTGDITFSRFLSHAKRESLLFLALHSTVYAVVICVIIYTISRRRYAHWKFFILFGSHFFIDYYKCYIFENNITGHSLAYDIIDQMLHLIVLAFIYFSSFTKGHNRVRGTG
jgi:hypothetical protein